MPSQVRTNFTSQESNWFKEDTDILDLKAIKNELESYSYDLKNNIDDYGPYEKFVDPAIRKDLISRLQQTVDWIYGEGQSAPA